MRILQSIGCLAPALIVIYGFVGVLLLTQFGGQVLNYLTSMGWEQAPGMIVSTQIEDSSDTTGERYAGRVIYTYEVDGVIYEGDQLDLRGPTYVRDREGAERLLDPYPVGTSVMVYFDPSDPTRAVLDRNLQGAVWGFVGVGSVLLILSVGLGIRHLAIRQQSS